jgi:hypothetical protein
MTTAAPESEQQKQLAQLKWGDYDVPALEGVHGTIAFDGPLGRVYTIIGGRKVTLAKSAGKPDTVVRSDIPGELLRLVCGEANLITTLLQNRAEADGDLMLLAQVAGSMPEVGRLATQAASEKGGR